MRTPRNGWIAGVFFRVICRRRENCWWRNVSRQPSLRSRRLGPTCRSCSRGWQRLRSPSLPASDAYLPLGTCQSMRGFHREESSSQTDLQRSSRSLKALSESGSASTHLTITDESMTYFMGAARATRGWRERRCPRAHASGGLLHGSDGCVPEPDAPLRDRRAFRSGTPA